MGGVVVVVGGWGGGGGGGGGRVGRVHIYVHDEDNQRIFMGTK